MNESNFFLTIDLGGSRLRAKAFSIDDANKSLEFELPGQNLRLVGDLELGKTFLAIRDRIEVEFGKNIFTWLIGAAGTKGLQDKRRISQLLGDLGINHTELRVFPDAEAAWAAAFGGKPGIITINGTGSVVFGRSGDAFYRKGGWGYLLDNSPSGSYFGRLAIKRLLQEWEEKPDEPILSRMYAEKFPNWPQDRAELVNLVYSTPNPQQFFGTFSPLFLNSVEKGCKWCSEMLFHSLETLFSQIVSLRKTCFNNTAAPLCGIGGLWENSAYFVEKTTHFFRNKDSQKIQIVKPAFSGVIGPLILYFLEKGKDISKIQPSLILLEKSTK
ncbi:MAG: hypothetical protein HQM08_04820 [Candidatus Riflebacteria bacterium]|nr:hypothetical protein [Candidatus Riflebacteria bacterium]